MKGSRASALIEHLENAQQRLEEGTFSDLLARLKTKKLEAEDMKKGKGKEVSDDELATRKTTYLGSRKVKGMTDDDAEDK